MHVNIGGVMDIHVCGIMHCVWHIHIRRIVDINICGVMYIHVGGIMHRVWHIHVCRIMHVDIGSVVHIYVCRIMHKYIHICSIVYGGSVMHIDRTLGISKHGRKASIAYHDQPIWVIRHTVAPLHKVMVACRNCSNGGCVADIIITRPQNTTVVVVICHEINIRDGAECCMNGDITGKVEGTRAICVIPTNPFYKAIAFLGYGSNGNIVVAVHQTHVHCTHIFIEGNVNGVFSIICAINP